MILISCRVFIERSSIDGAEKQKRLDRAWQKFSLENTSKIVLMMTFAYYCP
jgi:hypothetical protein